MRAFAVYTAARVLLFAALAGLLWLLGLSGYPLLFLAILLSMPLSYLVLARQRTALAEQLERRVGQRRARRERLRARLRDGEPPEQP